MKSRRGRDAVPSADSTTKLTKKHSASPLIDPAVCALVVIGPHEDERSRASTSGDHIRKTKRLVAAARAIDVPMLVCCEGTNSVAAFDMYHTFSCDAYDSIWNNQAFQKALDTEDKSALVLAGYWLDREVTAAALHALAECYDVYVPLDASPARSKEAGRLAEARLLQAGATPLLTEQILHEWMLETSNPSQRAKLTALME